MRTAINVAVGVHQPIENRDAIEDGIVRTNMALVEGNIEVALHRWREINRIGADGGVTVKILMTTGIDPLEGAVAIGPILGPGVDHRKMVGMLILTVVADGIAAAMNRRDHVRGPQGHLTGAGLEIASAGVTAVLVRRNNLEKRIHRQAKNHSRLMGHPRKKRLWMTSRILLKTLSDPYRRKTMIMGILRRFVPAVAVPTSPT